MDWCGLMFFLTWGVEVVAGWRKSVIFADLSNRNKMNQQEMALRKDGGAVNEIREMALANQQRAKDVLRQSGIEEIWQRNGCRVNLVGSLRMGLLASHRDIDLHVYSRGITEQSSFAIAAQIAALPEVAEIKCINGLHTEEHCMAWHVLYRYGDETWQLDIIHIEEGSEYDGYFERMADRILEVMTPEQRDTILRLKFSTPPDRDFHGVEYYEAVIADGVCGMPDFERWVTAHRQKPPYYWIP